jgi:hypothetical protein
MAFLGDDAAYKNIFAIIIFIEFFLISVIVLMTILLKILYFFQKKYDKVISKIIKYMLLRLIYKHENFYRIMYPISWARLYLLIPIIIELDTERTEASWRNVKDKLIKEIVLPRAKVVAKNFDIRDRVLAAEAFIYLKNPDPLYEQCLLNLIKDDVPIVSLVAIYAGFKYGTEEMINEIIICFSKQSWLYYSSNLNIFKNYIEDKNHFIVKKMKDETDLDVRAVCYDILTQCEKIKITWDIRKDVLSENFSLRICALKFLTQYEREKAIPLLINSLDDPVLEVKLVAVHRLRYLKAIESIPYLKKKLLDPDLFVRLSAAKALISLGLDKKELANMLSIDPKELLIKVPYTEHTYW